MPAAHYSKTVTSKPRKDPETGIKRSKVGSRNGKNSQEAAAIFADSLATVRFQPIPGPKVFFFREGLDNGEEWTVDVMGMLAEDLQAIYRQMKWIINKELAPDMMRFGLEPSALVTHAISEIRKMIPREFEFNIDYEGSHFITIYKYCDFDLYWKTFEIGKVVKKLHRYNMPLHDLFLLFLKSFSCHCGVDFWWNGYMCYSFDVFEERLDEYMMNEDLDPKECKEYREEINLYKSGLAYKYQKLIGNLKPVSAKTILKKLAAFKSTPITQLIKKGCEIMDGNNLQLFAYDDADYNESCYLPLEGQANIVWEFDSILITDHQQVIDAEASEGIQSPFAFQVVKPDTPSIEFKALSAKALWPKKLENFIDTAQELIKRYVNERKNRSTDKKLQTTVGSHSF